MMPLRKPSRDAVADPVKLQTLVQSYYDALVELQALAQAASPASVAGTAGKTAIVVLRGATVTLPGSTATFTADIYVTGVVG